MEKKNNKSKKVLASVLAVVLAFAMLIGGGTYAYLQSSTEDVKNSFSTNSVEVKLAETTGSDYDIVPGTEQAKDPKVTVKNTVDAYVYVEVKDNTQGLITYAVADGWAKLEGFDNIYYREVAKDADVKEFSFLAGDKVSYSKDLTNEDMKDKTDVSLTFNATAIQKEPFGTALNAYNKQVPAGSSENLTATLESGQNAVLTEDVTYPKTPNDETYIEVNMKGDNSVLDLNNHTLTIPFISGVFQGKGTIQNGTVSTTNGHYPLFIGNNTLETDITVKNIKVINGGINVYAAKVVLENCYVDASNKRWHAVWGDQGSDILIKSGTYISGTEGKAALNGENAVMKIEGGKFNTSVENYVAEGFKQVTEQDENGKTWYVVVPATA